MQQTLSIAVVSFGVMGLLGVFSPLLVKGTDKRRAYIVIDVVYGVLLLVFASFIAGLIS